MLYRPRSLKSWQGLLGARLPAPTLKGPRSLRPAEGEGPPGGLDEREGHSLGSRPGWGTSVTSYAPWRVGTGGGGKGARGSAPREDLWLMPPPRLAQGSFVEGDQIGSPST